MYQGVFPSDTQLTANQASLAQGEQEQVSGWATAATIFRQMSGYLYAILQALTLAITPLVIIALFIPGTGFNPILVRSPRCLRRGGMAREFRPISGLCRKRRSYE